MTYIVIKIFAAQPIKQHFQHSRQLNKPISGIKQIWSAPKSLVWKQN